MPIIIEGGSRSAGWWWARHLQNTEQNERAELVESGGVSSETVEEMFQEMRALAKGTKCDNYFYQASINPRADEQLTPAQWREAVATLGRNLGLEGQPYFVIEHEKNGRTHRHIVWSRIDQERMVAVSDSLTAKIHEQTSRQLEVKFDLARGKSILVADRDFERPERKATKAERFRAAKSGVDVEALSIELKAIRQRSDNGQSFQAGLEAAGYILARGDRRDFLIVDQVGHEHSLGRRLGMKAAELRNFMKGVNIAGLPGVEEARTRQRARLRTHESRPLARVAGQGGTAGNERGKEPSSPRSRSLNATQGAVRTAWSLSRTPEQLSEGLAARGIGLAVVSAEEAAANQRARAFAKETGRFVRPQREGEIVAVNERGHVYQFDQRATGAFREEIEKRLGGVDRASLLSVNATREAMRDASRAAAADERRRAREQAQARTGIEHTILAAHKRAAGDPQAFAKELDREGLAVIRATTRDEVALETLRRDQQLEQTVGDREQAPHRQRHFGWVREGELAAVTRSGNVYRLNEQHLGAAICQLEAAAILPSVTEARANFEIEREAAAAFRQEMINIQLQRRAEGIEARIERATAKELKRELRNGANGVKHDAEGIARKGEAALFRTAQGATRSAAKLFESVADMIIGAADFLAGPAPSPTIEEVRGQEQAAEERQQRTIDQAEERAFDAAREEEIRQLNRRQQERDLRLAQTLGTPATAEANLGRDEYDRQRERERER